MRRLLTHDSLLAVIATLALALPALAQDKTKEKPKASDKPATGLITQDGIIKGEMTIDFKSRTQLDTTGKLKAGSSALGAKDTYDFKLTAADTTEYVGKIFRQPQLLSGIILSEKQPAQLEFKVDLAVRDPKDLSQRRVVGKWAGTVPIDPKTGVYTMTGAKDSLNRFAVTAPGLTFTDQFGGKLVGKSKQEEGLASYTYKRLIGDKTMEIKVTKVDPMKFDDLELAKGPSPNYPHTIVNGRLDYDYETGNWLTDGIRFTYDVRGESVTDVLTGSIKWVEDENRKANGKGYYDFNLRINENDHKGESTEADAFAELDAEEAFFKVDTSVPCLTGQINYEDKFIGGGGDEPVPASSKVVFALNANKISKVQAVNFIKLWLLCIGPTNDE